MQNLCEAHVLYNINHPALCLIHFVDLSVRFSDVDNYSGVPTLMRHLQRGPVNCWWSSSLHAGEHQYMCNCACIACSWKMLNWIHQLFLIHVFFQPFCPVLLHKLNLASIILHVSRFVSFFAAGNILITIIVISVIMFVIVIVKNVIIIITVRIVMTVGNRSYKEARLVLQGRPVFLKKCCE